MPPGTLPPLNPAPSSGFRAQVDVASLAELVQLNCLGRQRACFEVRSGHQIGLLFFQDGQVIHAELGTLQGVEAVQQMLALESGQFHPCSAPWPKHPSIFDPWESLLLRAAQAYDEAHKKRTGAAGRVVEFPGAAKPMNEQATPHPSLATVHLDEEGEVISQRGHPGAMVETAAYVRHVGDIVGESLGLGPLLALEVTTKGQHLHVYRDEQDGAFALRGTEDELRSIEPPPGSKR